MTTILPHFAASLASSLTKHKDGSLLEQWHAIDNPLTQMSTLDDAALSVSIKDTLIGKDFAAVTVEIRTPAGVIPPLCFRPSGSTNDLANTSFTISLEAGDIVVGTCARSSFTGIVLKSEVASDDCSPIEKSFQESTTKSRYIRIPIGPIVKNLFLKFFQGDAPAMKWYQRKKWLL